ncbi:hypothetical protein D3C73_1324770 [compost metagenome]
MPDQEHLLEAGLIAFHQVDHGPRILKNDAPRPLQIKRALNGIAGELEDAEAPFFTIKLGSLMYLNLIMLW